MAHARGRLSLEIRNAEFDICWVDAPPNMVVGNMQVRQQQVLTSQNQSAPLRQNRPGQEAPGTRGYNSTPANPNFNNNNYYYSQQPQSQQQPYVPSTQYQQSSRTAQPPPPTHTQPSQGFETPSRLDYAQGAPNPRTSPDTPLSQNIPMESGNFSPESFRSNNTTVVGASPYSQQRSVTMDPSIRPSYTGQASLGPNNNPAATSTPLNINNFRQPRFGSSSRSTRHNSSSPGNTTTTTTTGTQTGTSHGTSTDQNSSSSSGETFEEICIRATGSDPQTIARVEELLRLMLASLQINCGISINNVTRGGDSSLSGSGGVNSEARSGETGSSVTSAAPPRGGAPPGGCSGTPGGRGNYYI